MATVNLSGSGTTGFPTRRGRKVPFKASVQVTGSAAATEKGSALAAADILQVMDVPADTLVLTAGLKVTTAEAGTATFDLGYGVDADRWVDGFDATSTGQATPAAAAEHRVVFAAADTIDLTLATYSGASDQFVADVWAVMLDISPDVVPDKAKADLT